MRGASRVDLDGGLDAQALRFEGNIGGSTVGIHGIIKRFAAADRVGNCVEESCCGQFAGAKARLAMFGAAVFSDELAGLLRSTVDLGRLKLHATRLAGRSSWLGRLVLVVALQVQAIDAFIDQPIQSLVAQPILPVQPAMQAIGDEQQDDSNADEIVGPVHHQNRAWQCPL